MPFSGVIVRLVALDQGGDRGQTFPEDIDHELLDLHEPVQHCVVGFGGGLDVSKERSDFG